MTTTSVASSGGEGGAPGVGETVSTTAPGADPGAQRQHAKQMVWLRFTIWLVLSVLVGLAPTISEYLHSRQTAGSPHRSFWEWCSEAQLYPMAMSLVIASVGEALMQLMKKASAALVLVTVNNLIIMVFAAILSPSSGDENEITEVVGQQSLIAFLVAVAGSGLCTLMCAKAAAAEETAQ
ncbi:hypothetical protein ACFW34_29240 [Streptomyces sp. NPDC058848]|uniref:hypothetical protein n=1 Tax=unclassified Streptomyces TaxID=2593676 RepID=UPI0036CC5101